MQRKYWIKTGCAVFMCLSVGWATINTNGQKGVVRTLSGKTKGISKMDIGIGVNYAQDRDYVKGPESNNYGPVLNPDGTPVDFQETARLLSSNFFLSIGAASFLDFAVMLPFYYDWAGFGSMNEGGLGDLEVSAKLLYPPPKERRVFYQSYYLAVSAPTGMKNNGIFPRHLNYYERREDGTRLPTEEYYSSMINVKPMILWTFDIGSVVEKFQFQIHVNLGGGISLDFDKSNTLIGNIALEYSPAEVVSLFVDFAGEVRVHHFASAIDLNKDPLMISPGIRINAPAGIYLLLSGDFCISSKEDRYRTNWDLGPASDRYRYSTAIKPRYGFQFQFGWEGFLAIQDDDKDGVKNDNDRCPKDKEDIDGFEDADGCPDEDNDKDGIKDADDKCPDKVEDKDGFEDEDGCPDPDNDKDGIPDLQDQCPKIAEDFDGIEDKDGCPDTDNDKDGIPDSLDKCPNDPEDVDKFEDEDGCPDIDNDKDGVPDLKDKCPNEPETINGIDDQDGCPDVKETKKEPNMPKHQIMHGVTFKSGSVDMAFSSFQFLEPIIKVMKEYPQVEIEIRGHTDSVGKYESNMRLSQMRAESVRQYLIAKGIDAGRMRAVGFGPSSPIADNRTATGRTKNRRIEIVRIK